MAAASSWRHGGGHWTVTGTKLRKKPSHNSHRVRCLHVLCSRHVLSLVAASATVLVALGPGWSIHAAPHLGVHSSSVRQGSRRKTLWDKLVGAVFGKPAGTVFREPVPEQAPQQSLFPTSQDDIPDLVLADLKVLHYPHPSLLQPSADVARFDGRLQQFAKRLLHIMHETGVGGLSAPQVGVNLRIIACNPDPSEQKHGTIFVNPRILEVYGLEDTRAETCLSFPHMRGTVKRASRVRLQAYDADGTPFRRTLTGIGARIFLHEYDHLNGIVFTDRVADHVREILQPKLDNLVDVYLQEP